MTRFSKEYASALYSLAREEGMEAELNAQLDQISDLMRTEPEYLRLLDARSVEAAERRELVDAAFGAQAHPYITRFMKLLIDRGGIRHFPECAAAYKQMYDADFGVETADAVSAAELSPAQKDALKAKLEKMTRRKVELRCAVDPSLIGGVRVDLMGRRYDNTVRARLDGMRRTLLGNE